MTKIEKLIQDLEISLEGQQSPKTVAVVKALADSLQSFVAAEKKAPAPGATPAKKTAAKKSAKK